MGNGWRTCVVGLAIGGLAATVGAVGVAAGPGDGHPAALVALPQGGTITAPTATFVVDTETDAPDASPGDGTCATAGGDCSLRAAIEEANALADQQAVELPAGSFDWGGEIQISGEVLLDGVGTSDLQGTMRMVPGSAVDLVEITLTGRLTSSPGDIGPITVIDSTVSPTATSGLDASTSLLRFESSTVTGLSLGAAARIETVDSTLHDVVTAGADAVHVERSTLTGASSHFDVDDLTIVDSLVDGFSSSIRVTLGGAATVTNSTLIAGQALQADAGGTLTVEYSTVIGSSWGVRALDGATVTVRNSVVIGEASALSCVGVMTIESVVSDDDTCGGGPLSGVDPLLGPLQDNGGPTHTRAPLVGSPVADAATGACPAADQRGETRPFDADDDGIARCDVGAVEAQSLLVEPIPLVESLEPARLVDTRTGPIADTIDDDYQGDGPIESATTYEVQIAGRGGIAADAAAAVLNLTTVDPKAPGFLTIDPCAPTRPLASAINYATGDVVNNEVVAKLSDHGTICIYASATTDLVVDGVGYAPDGSDYVPIDPARLTDTRPAPVGDTIDGLFEGDGKIATRTTYEIQIAGRGGIAADASAALLNLTTVDPQAPGFLTIHPCKPTRPLASAINYVAGAVVNNEITAKLSPTGSICVFASAETDVVIDAVGYVPPGSDYAPIDPARLTDTRGAPFGETIDGLFGGDGAIPGKATYEIQIAGRGGVAADATSAVLNLTTVDPGAAGFLTIFPCGVQPLASAINYVAGAVVNNEIIAKLSPAGAICVYASSTTHIVIDAVGFLGAT